jgi:hypothetical protein
LAVEAIRPDRDNVESKLALNARANAFLSGPDDGVPKFYAMEAGST